jgi:hypothetical protein
MFAKLQPVNFTYGLHYPIERLGVEILHQED